MASGSSPSFRIDFGEIIRRAVESDELDYKAAMNWHTMSRGAKAKIVRHCLAMANTKGGFLVIGVGEDASGHPSVYTGLSAEELHSFDPSAVGAFVNQYVEPAIDFTLERPEVDGKRYVVLVIRPFTSLPHVCVNAVENELQTGVFYIRTTDASSRPARRAIEMHSLIQRSLRNQRELLGKMLRGILYENKDFYESALNNFEADFEHAVNFFKKRKYPHKQKRHVLISILAAPGKYHEKRFGLSDIKHAVDEAFVSYSKAEFLDKEEMVKAYFTNFSLRYMAENGSCLWQICQSGAFHYAGVREIEETGLAFDRLVKLIAEALNFAIRVYATLGVVDDPLPVVIKIENTENCQLFVPGKENRKFVCRIPQIKIRFQRNYADWQSATVPNIALIIQELAERFNMPDELLKPLPELLKGYLEKRQLS